MTLSKDGGAGAFQDWCQFQTVAMESPALFKMEHVETALSLSLYIYKFGAVTSNSKARTAKTFQF